MERGQWLMGAVVGWWEEVSWLWGGGHRGRRWCGEGGGGPGEIWDLCICKSRI